MYIHTHTHKATTVNRNKQKQQIKSSSPQYENDEESNDEVQQKNELQVLQRRAACSLQSPVCPAGGHSPLGALTQVDARQSPAASDRRLDQNRWVPLGVRTVQTGGPVAPDGHRLVLTPHAHQELERDSMRERQRETDVCWVRMASGDNLREPEMGFRLTHWEEGRLGGGGEAGRWGVGEAGRCTLMRRGGWEEGREAYLDEAGGWEEGGGRSTLMGRGGGEAERHTLMRRAGCWKASLSSWGSSARAQDLW